MKTKFGIVSIILAIGLLASCVTGDYMAMKPSDHGVVLGIAESTFIVPGSFRYRRTINREAYISLMAEAQKQYPGVTVDIRDITWVIGQGDAANNNYEYSAMGKVIKVE